MMDDGFCGYSFLVEWNLQNFRDNGLKTRERRAKDRLRFLTGIFLNSFYSPSFSVNFSKRFLFKGEGWWRSVSLSLAEFSWFHQKGHDFLKGSGPNSSHHTYIKPRGLGRGDLGLWRIGWERRLGRFVWSQFYARSGNPSTDSPVGPPGLLPGHLMHTTRGWVHSLLVDPVTPSHIAEFIDRMECAMSMDNLNPSMGRCQTFLAVS